MTAEKSLSPKRLASTNHSVTFSDDTPPPLPSEPPPALDNETTPSSGVYTGSRYSQIPIHNGGSTTSRSKTSIPTCNSYGKPGLTGPKGGGSSVGYLPGRVYSERVASPPGYSAIGPVSSPPGFSPGYGATGGCSPEHNSSAAGKAFDHHVYAVPMKDFRQKEPLVNHGGRAVDLSTANMEASIYDNLSSRTQHAPKSVLVTPPGNKLEPDMGPSQSRLSPKSYLSPPHSPVKVPSSGTLSSSTSSCASISSVIHVNSQQQPMSTSMGSSTSSVKTPVSEAKPPSGASPERMEKVSAVRPKVLGKLDENHTQDEGHCPGGQSMGSSLGISSSQPSTPKSERSGNKQTLGEIIQQIEAKFKVLLRRTDYSSGECTADLQYISQQSRYSSDINIKRRLLGKLVENGLLDLFVRVFGSVRKTDYLGSGSDAVSCTSREELRDHFTNGSVHGSYEGLRDDDDKDSSIADDTSSIHERHSHMTDAMKNLRYVVNCFINCTDKCPQLCDQCAKRGLSSMLLQELDDPRFAVSELKDHSRMFLVKSYLTILNNIIRYHDKSRESYREAGAVRILQPFLKTSILLVKTKAIMLMSYVVNEAENDLVYAGADKSVGFLLKMLQNALDASNRYSKKYGYWAVEIAAGLNRLASCESNKSSIVHKSGVPLYSRLIDRSCSDEEHLVAALGLWTLAFHEPSRQVIRDEPSCLSSLEALSGGSQREEVRRAARGAVWLVTGQLPPPRSSYTHKSKSQDGPVVISFQWSSRGVVIKIRDKLRAAGYHVVTHTDCNGGSAVDKMSEVLEQASVVLVAVSHKYHQSPSCRTELEVACRLGCELITLRVQPRYSTEGWLARLTDTRLSFDFTHDVNLDAMTTNLINELGSRGRTGRMSDSAEGSVSLLGQRGGASTSSLQTVTAQVHSAPRTSSYQQWTTDHVAQWLTDNSLQLVVERFKQIDGSLLVELKKMQRLAPETFYTTLRHEMRFDLVTTLRFTKAMATLGS